MHVSYVSFFFTLKRNRLIEKITVPPCRHPLEIYGTNVVISCFQIPSFCGRWGTGVTLRTSTWICLATQKQGQAKLCSGCTLSRVRLGAVQVADCGSDRGGRAKTLCLASAPPVWLWTESSTWQRGGSPAALEDVWEVNRKAVKDACWGSQLHPPPAPVWMTGNFCAASGVCWNPGPVKRLPEVPRGRKMSRRHRKGKQALWGTLCAAGFGSAPVLTSSGTRSQMYSSPVVFFLLFFKKKTSKPSNEFAAK